MLIPPFEPAIFHCYLSCAKLCKNTYKDVHYNIICHCTKLETQIPINMELNKLQLQLRYQTAIFKCKEITKH